MVSTRWRCTTGSSTVSRNHSAHKSCFFFSHEGQKLPPRQEKGREGPPPRAWLVYSDRAHLQMARIEAAGIVIGRDTDRCDVALQDFGISRVHARIDVGRDGAMTLKDLKSESGSQVNGIPVTESPLAPGDRVLLGKVEFVVVGALP